MPLSAKTDRIAYAKDCLQGLLLAEGLSISLDDIQVVWAAKVLGGFKTILMSPILQGTIYEVTLNETVNEAYLDIYQKLKNVKVAINE